MNEKLARSRRGALMQKDARGIADENVRRLNVIRSELRESERSIGMARPGTAVHEDLLIDREFLRKKEMEIHGDIRGKVDRRGIPFEDEETLRKFDGKPLAERALESKAHMYMRDHGANEHSARIAAAISVVSGIDASVSLKMADKIFKSNVGGVFSEDDARKRSKAITDDIFNNGKNSKYFPR
jgi:hypothetical protein